MNTLELEQIARRDLYYFVTHCCTNIYARIVFTVVCEILQSDLKLLYHL
jgi:hypothetical protein